MDRNLFEIPSERTQRNDAIAVTHTPLPEMVIQRTQMADHDRTLAVYAASNGLCSMQHMCQISHVAQSLGQPDVSLL